MSLKATVVSISCGVVLTRFSAKVSVPPKPASSGFACRGS